MPFGDSLQSRLRRVVRREPAKVASPVKAKKAIAPAGIPGYLLRVTPSTEPVNDVLDREVSDPSEAAAIRAGWLLIDAYERLSRRAARRVFKAELAAWHQYAEDTIAVLNHPTSTSGAHKVESRTNILRYRRMTDFAQPGDRVFDVGFGRGYLAAQLVKYRQVEAYHGIEVEPEYVPEARELFEANGLATAEIELEIGDLYDLTRDRIEATGANLVICCEVLEHVPDAEAALRTLADALPEGADLMFSVPLFGRLETTWGHVSVFDVARLKQMLDGAGLYAHHVEPLANVWSLVVASRDPARSERVRSATGRPPVRVNAPLSNHRDFLYPKNTELTALANAQVVPDPSDEQRVTCRIAGDGGVVFPVSGLESLRFFFDFIDPVVIRSLAATAYVGSKSVASWTWAPKPEDLVPRVWQFAMRPGEGGAQFVSGPHTSSERADRVEVRVLTEPGATAELGLKVSYLP